MNELKDEESAAKKQLDYDQPSHRSFEMNELKDEESAAKKQLDYDQPSHRSL